MKEQQFINDGTFIEAAKKHEAEKKEKMLEDNPSNSSVNTEQLQVKREAEMKKFIEELMVAEELMIPCRNFVRPEYNKIRLEDRLDPRSISVKELFEKIGVPEEDLKEIYKFDEEEGDFTGSFTEYGQQILANLLKKKINFYYSPEQFHVDPESKETFEPKEDN